MRKEFFFGDATVKATAALANFPTNILMGAIVNMVMTMEKWNSEPNSLHARTDGGDSDTATK